MSFLSHLASRSRAPRFVGSTCHAGRRERFARILESVVYVSHRCKRACRYIIIEASCRFGRGRPVPGCLSLDPRVRSVYVRARARAQDLLLNRLTPVLPHRAVLRCALPCRAVPVTSDTVKRGHYFECVAAGRIFPWCRSTSQPAGRPAGRPVGRSIGRATHSRLFAK